MNVSSVLNSLSLQNSVTSHHPAGKCHASLNDLYQLPWPEAELVTKNMTVIVPSVKPGDTVTELVTNTTVTVTGSANDMMGMC